MADHWIENHKRDSWRRQAKSKGYRARSAFKLLQIQTRFKLIREGDVVESCQPVEGATLLVGDITDELIQERILEELDNRPINTIVSDISPDITGKWDVDQTVAMTLVADVFDFSMKLLCKGGSFTSKLFQGVGVEELIKAVKPYFSEVRRFSPDASRNSSSEVYLICRNYMPWVLKRGVKIRDVYEKLLEPKLSGNEIEDGPEAVFTSFNVRKKKSSN